MCGIFVVYIIFYIHIYYKKRLRFFYMGGREGVTKKGNIAFDVRLTDVRLTPFLRLLPIIVSKASRVRCSQWARPPLWVMLKLTWWEAHSPRLSHSSPLASLPPSHVEFGPVECVRAALQLLIERKKCSNCFCFKTIFAFYCSLFTFVFFFLKLYRNPFLF